MEKLRKLGLGYKMTKPDHNQPFERILDRSFFKDCYPPA
jgi:hypothetical protein